MRTGLTEESGENTGPRLESQSSRIGAEVQFGKNVSIIADSIQIEDKVVFGDNVSIVCRGAFKIGHHGIVGAGATVNCNSLSIGHWLFSCEGLEIGAGGCQNKEADLKIGNGVGIFERVLINLSSQVTIGDNCGIGREVQIWTHGAWLDPLAGFPSDFGPVSIGDNVWLPARSIMLPNSSIGDNSVIGINSIINKHIPSGSFAAGCPARVIRENAYPDPLDASAKDDLIQKIVSDWETQILYKVPDLNYVVECVGGQKIRLEVADLETIFDCSRKTVVGSTNPYSEDLRDHLRRRGVKIYTEDFFKSLQSGVPNS